MHQEHNKIKKMVKKQLADYLGIEPEDIGDEDSLREDLHMSSTDISDFFHSLGGTIPYTFDDISQLETITDICDELSENIEF